MFQRDLRSYDMIISLENWEKTTLLAPEKLKQNLSHDFVIVIPQPNTVMEKHEAREKRHEVAAAQQYRNPTLD